MVNPFRLRIARGEITHSDELKACYRAQVKLLHPDLQGAAAPGVDFDRLKRQYLEAHRFLLSREDQAAPGPEPAGGPERGLASRNAFLDEFQNLMARGFPVNLQAASQNRAYAACIRLISGWLSNRFSDPGFFARVNAETRSLKRSDKAAHWSLMQIFWTLGYNQLGSNEHHRRTIHRYWASLQPVFAEHEATALAQLLKCMIEDEDESLSGPH